MTTIPLRSKTAAMHRIRHQVSLIALISAGVMAGSLASAQSANDASEDFELAPIIVTGEKIDRPFTDTFTSVGVATSEDLDNFSVSGLPDAFRRMANVRWNQTNGGNNGFTIRGVNSEGMVSPENNTPVASVIIDGASQSVESARRGSRGTWDIEQVEVLRGPQSLLQGRAALAGAVVVKTKDPTFTPEAGLRGVIGTEDRLDGALYVSGGVSDSLALRFSAEYHEQNADIDYADDSLSQLGEDRYRNLRGKLLWKPAAIDGLEVLLTISDTFDKTPDRTVTGDFSDREYDGSALGAELREADNRNYIAEVKYDINGYLKFESVSAWVDAETRISSPNSVANEYYRKDKRDTADFTQDFRLVLGENDDQFSGVVGLFYGDFDYTSDSLINYPALGFLENDLLQDLDTTRKTEQISAYADLRYRFTDRTQLLAGGRFLHEKVSITQKGTAFDFGQFGYVDIDYDGSNTYNEFLPSLGLSHDITEQQSVALTGRKGYRSGFVEVVGSDINEIDPEYVWTYELVYRHEAADSRWLFGANLFYNDYDNQQIPVVANGIYTDVYTVNAGKSHSYGAELEGRYNFNNGLSLYGALGWLESEFDELETAEGDFSGNEFPEAPRITGSLGAFYQHVNGFFVSADAAYTSSYYSTGSISNDKAVKVDSYWLANASIGYAWENFTLRAYVDNLFDKEYYTGLNNLGVTGAPATSATIGAGRNVGVIFDARF